MIPGIGPKREFDTCFLGELDEGVAWNPRVLLDFQRDIVFSGEINDGHHPLLRPYFIIMPGKVDGQIGGAAKHADGFLTQDFDDMRHIHFYKRIHILYEKMILPNS